MKFETIRHITLHEYIGFYFAEKKPNNWGQICEEYAELTGGNENSVFVDTYKRYLEFLTRRAIRVLEHEEPNEREDFEISRLEHDLQKLEDKNKSTEPMTHETFSKWILSVSKWVGYPIKREEITLFDFLIASMEMQKEVEYMLKNSKRNERKN